MTDGALCTRADVPLLQASCILEPPPQVSVDSRPHRGHAGSRISSADYANNTALLHQLADQLIVNDSDMFGRLRTRSFRRTSAKVTYITSSCSGDWRSLLCRLDNLSLHWLELEGRRKVPVHRPMAAPFEKACLMQLVQFRIKGH